MTTHATGGRRAAALVILAGSLLATALTGCSPRIDQRGNAPDPDDVLAIQPGVDDKAKVFQLLGSPSTAGTFDDKIWYYISKRTATIAFLEPTVLDQQVLEIKFDDGGLVKDMKLYGVEDGKVIDPVPRVTPTGGQELTFMKQLLGNIGKFNAADKGPTGGGPVSTPGH
jgi:outer membrane protein assembly factor BamE (lipoprotein component of BamABCDE complex)